MSEKIIISDDPNTDPPETPPPGFMLTGTAGSLPLYECGEYQTSPAPGMPPTDPLPPGNKRSPSYMSGQEIVFSLPTPDSGNILRLIVRYGVLCSSPPVFEANSSGGEDVTIAGETTCDFSPGIYRWSLYELTPLANPTGEEECDYEQGKLVGEGLFEVFPRPN